MTTILQAWIQQFPMHGPGMMGGWGWFGMIVGTLFALSFLVLIGLLIVALARYLGGASRSAGREESPLDLLMRRYARGEITRDDYQRMRQELQ
jgi:putative membrane protein